MRVFLTSSRYTAKGWTLILLVVAVCCVILFGRRVGGLSVEFALVSVCVPIILMMPTRTRRVTSVLVTILLLFIPSYMMPRLQLLGVGSLRIFVSEAVFAVVVGCFFLVSAGRRNFSWMQSSLAWPVLFFVIWFFSSTFMGVLRGDLPPVWAFQRFRQILPLLTYFVVLYGIRTRAEVRLVTHILLSFACFAPVMHFLAMAGVEFGIRHLVSTSGLVLDTRRIDSAIRFGISGFDWFPFLFLPVVVALLVCGRAGIRWMRVYTVIAILYTYIVVFSFARTSFVTMLVAIALIMVLSHRWKNVFPMAIGTVLIILVADQVLRKSPVLPDENLLGLVRARYLTVLNPLQQETFLSRMEEMSQAVQMARGKLLTGRGSDALYITGTREAGFTSVLVYHSMWASCLLWAGILGVLLFIWLSYRFLRQTWRTYRKQKDPWLAALALGVMATYVRLLLFSILGAFLDSATMPVLGTLMGLTVVIDRIGSEQLHPPVQEVYPLQCRKGEACAVWW